MSRIEEWIQELCPDGVEYKPLNQIADMKRGTPVTKKSIQSGEVPVISGGKEPAYYCNQSNRTGDIITVAGSGVGAGYVQYWSCPIFACDTFTVKGKDSVLTRYLYYCLSNEQDYIYSTQKGGGVPHVHISSIETMQIPVPPIPIQKEIVRILDAFSELEAELEARKQQYSYYRNELLSFDSTEVRCLPLIEISEMARGTSVTQKSICPGNIPVVSGGREPAYYCNKANREGDIITVAGSGAGAGYVQYWKAPIFVCDAFSIKGKNGILTRYLYHCLANQQEYIYSTKKGGGVPHVHISSIADLKIPVPSLPVQERIVNVLDHFDAICSNLNVGLPAEINARQKQYEYYRDALLSFATTKTPPRWNKKEIIALFQHAFGYVSIQLEDMETLGLITMGRGNVISKQYMTDHPGAYPVYSSAATNNGCIGICDSYMFDDTRITWSIDGGGKFFYRENEKYSVTNVCGWLRVENTSLINPRFLFYALENEWTQKSYDYTHKAHPSVIRKEYTILLPPLPVQAQIVETLDKFHALCADLTTGLPAEIAARHKQYEYYRDKLLSFTPR